MWDKYFDTSKVTEIRLKTTVYFGPGAAAKIDDIAGELKGRGVSQVLCVTGGALLPAYGSLGPRGGGLQKTRNRHYPLR